MKIVKMLLVSAVFLLSLGSPVMAEEKVVEEGLISSMLNTTADMFRDAKVATYWDFRNNKLLGGIAVPVVSWRELLSLDAGVISDWSDMAFALTISGNIQKLAELGGMDFKLPQNVNVGVFAARDFREMEYIYGMNLSYRINF